MNIIRFLIIVVISGYAATAAAKTIEKNYHETFPVNQSTTFHLKQGDGNVTITPWHQDKLEVKVAYKAQVIGIDVSDCDFEVAFRASGNDIHVTQQNKCRFVFGGLRIKRYRYDIKAPSYVKLDVRSSDGNVELRDWKNAVSIKSSDGNVRLSQIQADVQLKTSDGNVDVDGVTGNLDVRSSDGRVKIRDAKSPKLKIRTSDGSISLTRCSGNMELSASDGDLSLEQVKADRLEIKTSDGSVDADLLFTDRPDWRVKSSDGRIRIKMNKRMSARYTLSTSDGRIRVDHPSHQQMKTSRRHWRGQLNDGRGEIRVSSSDGSITLTTQ